MHMRTLIIVICLADFVDEVPIAAYEAISDREEMRGVANTTRPYLTHTEVQKP